MSLLQTLQHEGVIGEGYFSIVQRYKDRRTGKKYAVKKIQKKHDDIEIYAVWFKREVKLLTGKLSEHPNIVPILDYEISDDALRYVMPLAVEDLDDYLTSRNNSLNLQERCAIFEPIITAIAFAHSNKVIHRDINPGNVLLFDEGDALVVKVSDFGLAKDWSSLTAQTASAVKGYGRPFYAAPEQLSKLKNASARSDIYSLGKLLNFIMTGKEPIVLHDCEFTPVIRRATQYEPSDRYGDVNEFIEDYNRLASLFLGLETLTESVTLSEMAEDPENLDWAAFHKLASTGAYEGHVYHNYIDPVKTILSDSSRLDAYYGAVGAAIDSTVSTYVKELEKCIRSVGWPFTATNSISYMAYNLLPYTTSSEIKEKVFEVLWSIGFESNQWNVQDVVVEMLEKRMLPAASDSSIIRTIVTSRPSPITSVNKIVNAKVSQAIRRAARSHLNKLEQA